MALPITSMNDVLSYDGSSNKIDFHNQVVCLMYLKEHCY